MSIPAQSFPELISFLDGQSEPSIVMDAQYRIVAANSAYAKEFAQGRDVKGKFCYEVSHHFAVPCDQAGESCPLKLSQRNGQVHRVLHLHYTPRGEEHVDVATSPIRDEEGRIAFFVETMRVVKHASSRPAAEGLVGRSASFGRMLSMLMRVAPTDAAVLLLGETGTGKELVARLVHEAGQYSAGPFVAVDCSGLTESLFESELFGYEKGAFTGASHRKIGLVEAASGGTLFLDEIGDIPLTLQVKLLRLLETGTYRRVGGVETLRSEFRLLSATHRDLHGMVEKESFRRDLYHRVSTFPVTVPALSQRRDDIRLLANSLLKRVVGDRDIRFSEAAMQDLEAREYPGNIRELRNLIERATILADGNEISPLHLANDLRLASAEAPGSPADQARSPFILDQPVSLAELEQRYISWIEDGFSGDRESLAKLLGVGKRTLYRKMGDLRSASVGSGGTED
ncbi:MAG: sigma-54-dependent Fis family transcriptional regulator [Sulfuritalea sp.]|nr:sigma-54-dependent Fis family transcriptional regulator [Sulfuritalea sp.]MDP1984928.1 sigma-54-dependent Fis family transcriptional regulator [Sulfuritalea sp.]